MLTIDSEVETATEIDSETLTKNYVVNRHTDTLTLAINKPHGGV